MKITVTDGTTMEMSMEEYEVFAKVTKTVETTEDEADTHEYDGVTYRKVCEKVAGETEEKAEADELQVGDYAEVISKGGFPCTEYKVGDIVRLVEDDGSYIILFERLSDGIRNWVDKREVRKIDVTEYNGKKYVEVKRKAREGELIKIVNASTTFGEYGNGDVLVVEDVEQNAKLWVDAEAIEVFILHEEYVVLEPIGTHKTAAIVKFADGSKTVYRYVESVEL